MHSKTFIIQYIYIRPYNNIIVRALSIKIVRVTNYQQFYVIPFRIT